MLKIRLQADKKRSGRNGVILSFAKNLFSSKQELLHFVQIGNQTNDGKMGMTKAKVFHQP